jgi:hypothetical protein
MSPMLFLMLDRGLNKAMHMEKIQNLLEIILKNNSNPTTQA